MNIEEIVEYGIVTGLTKLGLEKIRDIIERKTKTKNSKKRKSRKIVVDTNDKYYR